MPKLVQVVPNERWQLVLEFATEGFFLFDGSVARKEMDWSDFSRPNKLKNLIFSEDKIVWPAGRELDASYLLSKSRPITAAELENQALRLDYKNQAPTSAHPSHHVFGTYLYPFRRQQFELEESIGGGHAEMGGSYSCSLVELLGSADWETHFEQSGCGWAVKFVKDIADTKALLDELVKQVCRRQG